MSQRLHLFFDLDGTLTDSAAGICACIQHALTQMGGRPPAPDEIRPFIGSPLRSIFESFLAGTDADRADATPPQELERAVELYRERFDAKGFAENRVYPGIRDGLEGLRAAGHSLHIATAKRPEDALRVARHFGFDDFFGSVFGAETAGERADKTRILARALGSTGAATRHSIMIGDRSHDMLAGLGTGATPLGAGWGYGSSRELREAGALHVAVSPEAMIQWIHARARALGPSPGQAR